MMKEMSVKRMMPSMHLNEKDLPEIKKWEVGKEYDILVHTKMMSSNKDIEGDPAMDMKKIMKKPMMSGRFEIMSAEHMHDDQANVKEEDYTKDKIKRLEEKSKE